MAPGSCSIWPATSARPRRTGPWLLGDAPDGRHGHETWPTSGAIPPPEAVRPGPSTRATWSLMRRAGPWAQHVPQDRDLNRGWSTEGRRYRALEREIASRPGTFFFCCLLYADDSDFPAAIDLGVLRPDGLHAERFRNRFDL
jgi:hypothetical protein